MWRKLSQDQTAEPGRVTCSSALRAISYAIADSVENQVQTIVNTVDAGATARSDFVAATPYTMAVRFG
jgi:hypothetical protein